MNPHIRSPVILSILPFLYFSLPASIHRCNSLQFQDQTTWLLSPRAPPHPPCPTTSSYLIPYISFLIAPTSCLTHTSYLAPNQIKPIPNLRSLTTTGHSHHIHLLIPGSYLPVTTHF